MPPKDTKAIYINLSGDGADDSTEQTPRERDTEDTLQAFLDEFGPQSAKLSLYRLKQGTAKYDWLAHYVPDTVTPETIREEWGAGTYAINLLDERGHYITRRIFDIGGKAEDWERARVTAGKNANYLPAEAPDNSANVQLQIEMMRQQHETLLALLNNRGSGVEDLLKVFVAMKDNTKPTDQLETLAAMMKLAREMGGNNDSVVGLIKDVAPAIIEPIGRALGGVAAAAKQNGTPPQVAAEVPGLPAPREVPEPQPKAAETASSSPGDDDAPAAPEEVSRLLYAQLQYWKGKARAGKDPGFWVDYVFENSDEPNIQAVLWAARRYDFAMLLQFDAEVREDGQLREWFRTVYETIRAELHQRDDPARGSGDAADAGDDAPPDTDGGDGPDDAPGDGEPVTAPAAGDTGAAAAGG